MPSIPDEIRYLREKAKQAREIAATSEAKVAEMLRGLAKDFEERADNLEKRL